MEDKAKREAKAQKEADERAKKAECEKQRQTTRALGTKQFGGALSSKSKTELEDIAAALALAEDGNKHVLIRRIKEHLTLHPELALNTRFEGLFASLARGCKREADSEEGPAAPQDGNEAVGNPHPVQQRRISTQVFSPPVPLPLHYPAQPTKSHAARGPVPPTTSPRWLQIPRWLRVSAIRTVSDTHHSLLLGLQPYNQTQSLVHTYLH